MNNRAPLGSLSGNAMGSKIRPPTKISTERIGQVANPPAAAAPTTRTQTTATARPATARNVRGQPPPTTRSTLSRSTNSSTAADPMRRSVSSAVPSAGQKRPATAESDNEALVKRIMTEQSPHLQVLMDQNHFAGILQDAIKAALAKNSETSVEQFKEALQGANQNREEQAAHLMERLQQLESHHRGELDKVKQAHEAQLHASQTELLQLRSLHHAAESELAVSRHEVAALRAQVVQHTAQEAVSQEQIRALKLRAEAAERDAGDKASLIEQLQEAVKAMQESVAAMEAKLRADEAIRRRLHNTILELKGNIRVFCRVRPSQAGETPSAPHIRYDEVDNRQIVVSQSSESVDGQRVNVKQTHFAFDRVFQPNASQAAVFEEISQLVQSALDGYRVCIFAYGQTGSGKTYTMEGPPGSGNDESMGMIPRSVYQVFATAEELKEKGWEYHMDVSFLEIYNETIRDLLGNGATTGKHEIKQMPNSAFTYVTDLKTVPVQTPHEVFSLLKKASQNRAVAETKCNERSSRSHSVFMLQIKGKNAQTGESSEGLLNLIDLAGSERVNVSGASGERLKETQAINKSLSTLATVIQALGDRADHVPYRDSKLTYLLANSLGGQSKVLMFVNVSPAPASINETVSSLRFATRVNQTDIGTARRVAK